MNVSDLIAEAAAIWKSESALARAAGFSQNAIWQARRKGSVSAEMANGIHRATKGKVPRWALRPDLWSPPAKARAKSADAEQGAAA